MKTIGLVGGISPKSTTLYYDRINNVVNELLGGHHSAKIVMVSVDFEEVVRNIFSNNWEAVAEVMRAACVKLALCQVDLITFCSNTLYKVRQEAMLNINVNLVHILDPVIRYIDENSLTKVALLGTQYTMEDDFHKGYLQNNSTVEVIVPELGHRQVLNQIIFDELCHGVVTDSSAMKIKNITDSLYEQGAEAVILGCTELPLIFPKIEMQIPVINTTLLHATDLAYRAVNKNLITMDRLELL